jgi:Fur family ferric uptake transcriptional regulator
VAALSAADGPRSPAELVADLGDDVPLSSLYRSLSVLGEAGVVTSHHGPGGVTRYELAEWLNGHHHHLVCVSCGLVEDVAIAGAHESTVEQVVHQIARRSGFRATDHALEIEGHCARCA